ncbi:hypothetical protein [Rhodococcus sp. AG1013]|uniref:hypothetical protein n=1 Tax=unclassified Rhodococcus (in: high G+C Gram-positive bacteria) TaxID=192944 RepID=UPI000E0C675D|nr:hypothetical protein [Rhodococcus sp. AG1013]RDI30440.1 hypothetical protein DEU38_10521 [Rhodococcus sp. AG1013]
MRFDAGVAIYGVSSVESFRGGTQPSAVVAFQSFQALAGIAVDGGNVHVTDHQNKHALALPIETPTPGPSTGRIDIPFGS